MSEPLPSPSPSRRSWISLSAVLFVQTQNAFNDNFVKMVLIGLGLAVAQGVTVAGIDLGAKIQFILTALIPIPFILGAPIAGWFSDRFSKKHIIIAALLMQLAVFALILVAILQRQVVAAIFGYFLLAVQSTLFSPAKQGILKELVGSSRLGLANGLMQMLTMIGILGGIGLGGWWFDSLLDRYNNAHGIALGNAWDAAKWPTVVAGLFCLFPLLVSFLIQPGPSHPARKFRPSICWNHFSDLGLLWRRRDLRLVAIRIALYWFVANFIALVFVSHGKEMYPDAHKGGAASATSVMMLCVGVGLALGSTVVSILSRSSIQLRLIPKGAIGMTTGLVGIALFDPSTLAFKASIGVVGFASGFFAVPLSAWLQDLAPEDERGCVISASNLVNSIAGIFAIGICSGLDTLDFSAASQSLVVVVVMGAITIWTLPFLRKIPPPVEGG